MKKTVTAVCLLICCFVFFSIAYYFKTIKTNKEEGKVDKTEQRVDGTKEYDGHNEENMDKSSLNISKETQEKSEEKKIQNILLLGIDKQENASDTIVVLTLDKANNTAKLTSIMRDTYVYFGEGMANKINYAYHYGGAQLTISKLNELFNLDISKYIKIDFNGLTKVIDTLGGININITNEERNYINNSEGISYVRNSGDVLLDGDQVLSYSRIRKIDSDFQRTARQRKVLFGIFKKLKEISIGDYYNVYSQMSSNIESNIQGFEMIKFGMFLNKINTSSAKDFRIPIDGTTSDNGKGVYHLDWDKEANTMALHDFIYGS